MVWKPFKAVAQKRKQRLQYENAKKMWAFMDNMTWADELFRLCMKGKDTNEVYEKYATLSSDFKFYVWPKYDRDKHKKPLSEEYMVMDEAWRLILLLDKTCEQTIEVKKEAMRLSKHHKAVNALMRHKIRKCMGACIGV